MQRQPFIHICEVIWSEVTWCKWSDFVFKWSELRWSCWGQKYHVH